MISEKIERCSLEDALDFANGEVVIDGFMNRYDVSKEEAHAIFNETKKWLWLAAKASEEEKLSLSIDKPLLIIDEMWHNFILHTKQYQRYCMDKFKRFIHHEPTPSADKAKYQEALASNPSLEIQKWKEKYQKQLSYIYDNLGPETVIKWYEEIPTKYSPEYLESIK
ncbi:MAG: hypothetical protein ACI9XJ_001983, partial [Marivirga sp.]